MSENGTRETERDREVERETGRETDRVCLFSRNTDSHSRLSVRWTETQTVSAVSGSSLEVWSMYRNEKCIISISKLTRAAHTAGGVGVGGRRRQPWFAKKTKQTKKKVSPQTHGNATPGHHLTVRGKNAPTPTRDGVTSTRTHTRPLSDTHTHTYKH